MSVAVIGNPKVNSRTRHAAELVVAAMTGSPPDTVIELSELGPGLLGWGDPAVAEAKQQVLKAGDLLVVATPTYKGTYTGLLKLFLDQFAAGAGQIDRIEEGSAAARLHLADLFRQLLRIPSSVY